MGNRLDMTELSGLNRVSSVWFIGFVVLTSISNFVGCLRSNW
jgi:hypothetical protein